jgi:Zn-dependent protease with chaperone function
MNFFERQRQVRRLSWRLVALFVLAVVTIVVVVDLIVALAFGAGDMNATELVGLMLVTSAATAAVIGVASLFRTVTLRGIGGAGVARDLNGRQVPADTNDPQLRRLRNVVEEIAIASSVPVPAIYVLEGESGINAFAAGWSPSDAVVAVTRGALDSLNRDELQGVIAHEFSHVVNGDMRLNMRLMGLLFGILALAVGGRVLMYMGGGRGRNNPLPLIGIALIVAGYGGVVVGRIIKAAVSRQREYLADASAVQFTRQTAGLVGALKKIAGMPQGSSVRNAKAEEVSHMLFGAGSGLTSLFATHPPLLKRIHVLDPSVDMAELERLSRQWAASPPSGMAEDAALGLTGRGETVAGGPTQILPAPSTTVAVQPAEVVATVGDPTDDAFRRAGAILDGIPDDLLARARRPDTVVPLVFGLLLSSYDDGRANQHALLVTRHGQAVADEAVGAAAALGALHPAVRLPLAELAFPTLRMRPGREQAAVVDTIHALIRADGEISVFEYCLSRLLHREMYEAMHRKPPWETHRRTLTNSLGAAATLLATLAQMGHGEDGAAARAFTAGMSRLVPQANLPYAPPTDGVRALEESWPALDGLREGDKEALVGSMVAVVADDGVMTVAEVELVRTICAMLQCPLPPLVPNEEVA